VREDAGEDATKEAGHRVCVQDAQCVVNLLLQEAATAPIHGRCTRAPSPRPRHDPHHHRRPALHQPLGDAGERPLEHCTKLNHGACPRRSGAPGAPPSRGVPAPALHRHRPRQAHALGGLRGAPRPPGRPAARRRALRRAAVHLIFFPWRNTNTCRAHLPIADPGATAAAGDHLHMHMDCREGYYVRCPRSRRPRARILQRSSPRRRWRRPFGSTAA
jgi:hypothetical protein